MRKLTRCSIRMVALTLLLSTACTEVIDIELDSTYRRLVVYGTITTDSLHHRVELTTSGDYFSNRPPDPVSGAMVELEFSGTRMLLGEYDSLPGVYRVPVAFRGVPGTTYRLEISQVDIDDNGIPESYRAESTMPSGLKLDSIRLSPFQSRFLSGYQVFLFALDPPERQWYGYKLWKNGIRLTDTLSEYSVQPDDFYNGAYIYGLPVGFLSDDNPDESLSPGDTVTFELNSIPRPYYDFVVDAQLEIAGNNPLFSGPPANIRSNIEPNGQGIFTAYCVQKVSKIVSP